MSKTKTRKPLDGFVIPRGRYVVNQKAPKFADRRTKRLRTRGACNAAAIRDAS